MPVPAPLLDGSPSPCVCIGRRTMVQRGLDGAGAVGGPPLHGVSQLCCHANSRYRSGRLNGPPPELQRRGPAAWPAGCSRAAVSTVSGAQQDSAGLLQPPPTGCLSPRTLPLRAGSPPPPAPPGEAAGDPNISGTSSRSTSRRVRQPDNLKGHWAGYRSALLQVFGLYPCAAVLLSPLDAWSFVP